MSRLRTRLDNEIPSLTRYQSGIAELIAEPQHSLHMKRAVIVSYISFITAIFAMAVGVLVLLGWATDFSLLKSLMPSMVVMKANTAICFLLLGLSLFLVRRLDDTGPRRWVASATAGLVLFISLLVIAEYLFGWNPGLDQWLFREPAGTLGTPYPGRMALNTALAILLLSLGLLLIIMRSSRAHRLSQYFGLAAALIGLLGLLGYLYQAQLFITIGSSSWIAAHTTITIMVLAAGLLCTTPGDGLMLTILSEGPGGHNLRILWPAFFLLSIIFGKLALLEVRAGHFDTPLGVVLAIIGVLVTYSVILVINSIALERADQGRRRAEEAVRQLAQFPEQNPDPVLRVTVDGALLFANAPAHLMLEAMEATTDVPLPAAILALVAEAATCHGVVETEISDTQGRIFELVANCPAGERYVNLYGRNITKRKQAEQALKRSEQIYRLLVNSIPNTSIMLFDKDLRFQVVGGGENEKNNIDKSQIEGKTLREAYPKDVADLFEPIYQKTLLGNLTSFEMSFGEYAYLQQTIPIKNTEGQVFGGMQISTNITERKRAEEVLAFQARLLSEVHDAIFSSDSNFTITYWNQAAEKMFGWTKDEVLGKNSGDLLQPQIEGSSRAQERSKLQSVGYWEGEVLYTRKDGTNLVADINSTVLKDAHGNDIGNVVVARDITERKRTDEALRDSEERFFKTFHSNPAALTITRADDNRYVDVNEKYLHLLEFERNEVLGRTAVELNLYPNLEERNAVMAQLFEQGYVRDHELSVRTRSGKILRVFFSLEMVVINGQPHVLASFVDITERKLMEEALQASLHEKDVLLKEIHHRVKNNMQVISSLVSLQSDTLDDPALRALFNDLRDQVRTMALVHEKLYQSESLANIDFAEYTRSLLSYLWRAHGDATVAVRLTLDVEPVTISIEQAVPCGLLLNELVTNALKHAFRDRTDGELTVALHANPDGQVCLSVRDNGVGLPANWRQSSSLGLQLVRMLTGQVRGTFDVCTEGGTAFILTFTQPTTSPPGENDKQG